MAGNQVDTLRRQSTVVMSNKHGKHGMAIMFIGDFINTWQPPTFTKPKATIIPLVFRGKTTKNNLCRNSESFCDLSLFPLAIIVNCKNMQVLLTERWHFTASLKTIQWILMTTTVVYWKTIDLWLYHCRITTVLCLLRGRFLNLLVLGPVTSLFHRVGGSVKWKKNPKSLFYFWSRA